MTNLIRTPARPPTNPAYIGASFVGRYDYHSADGRWYVERGGWCGGNWKVIDTTGEHFCTECPTPTVAEFFDHWLAIAPTLASAKEFINTKENHRAASLL